MKIIKKDAFKTLFLKKEQFIVQTDKATLINIKNDLFMWINNKFVKFEAVSKDGKEFNSISIKNDFEYELFLQIEKDGKTVKVESSAKKVSGKELLDLFFSK